jgi:predicted O-methyltransferase YrrM
LPSIFQLRSFISYWLNAVDEHSLHSPFFFDLYTKVIKRKTHKNPAFEQLREKLKNDHREIRVDDPGAGSRHQSGQNRKIRDIAKVSLSPAKFSSLYQRLIGNANAKKIVELGTSLGINSLYLSAGERTQVTTFEGSPSIAEIAKTTFEFADVQNISITEGNIDVTLPGWLLTSGNIDFAFIDANHRYEPTMKYFGWLLRKIHIKSMIVVDDIHYSPEMERAWHEITSNELVYGSADLYRCGLLFFDPSLNKQHVVLQF